MTAAKDKVKVEVCEGQRLLEQIDPVARSTQILVGGDKTEVDVADFDRLEALGVVKKV